MHAVRSLSLSTNCGHQNALLAGMLYAKDYADCAITIDADLQQDVNAMDEFLRCYAKGVDIVFGVRRSRDTDGLLKRVTAQAFYGLMHAMGANVIRNHADYRLLSKRVLLALDQYTEVNVFLRGLIRSLGFVSCEVPFRRERALCGAVQVLAGQDDASGDGWHYVLFRQAP